MIQINQYIAEKFIINSNTVSSIKRYNEFGKGELESLDIEDFVKEKFDINMTDTQIINFYDNLKSYKIDPDTDFYHISNDEVNKSKGKIGMKIQTLMKKDPNSESNYLNIKHNLQIAFKHLPNKKLFIILLVGYDNNLLLNEYFLYYR